MMDGLKLRARAMIYGAVKYAAFFLCAQIGSSGCNLLLAFNTFKNISFILQEIFANPRQTALFQIEIDSKKHTKNVNL